jgi:hypothetical protein
VPVAAARLAQVFAEVADTRADGPDLSAFLRLMTARVAEVVQSDAAGVLLADPDGRLQFVAGSDATTAMLELFQLQHHEGDRAWTASSPGNRSTTPTWPRQPIGGHDLRRWRLAAGFHAVHAVPMRNDHTRPASRAEAHTGQWAQPDTKLVTLPCPCREILRDLAYQLSPRSGPSRASNATQPPSRSSPYVSGAPHSLRGSLLANLWHGGHVAVSISRWKADNGGPAGRSLPTGRVGLSGREEQLEAPVEDLTEAMRPRRAAGVAVAARRPSRAIPPADQSYGLGPRRGTDAGGLR